MPSRIPNVAKSKFELIGPKKLMKRRMKRTSHCEGRASVSWSTWPLLTSLQLAKEYALTGDRIPARRAAEIGLANHVVPDDEVLDQALACPHRIAKLPKQATEDTKRAISIHLERAVLATLDFAFTAEDRSFTSPEVRANLDRFLKRR
jgi:enoyl-CoA hydratase